MYTSKKALIRCTLGLSLAALVVFAGCFASKFTLIPPDKAKVDRAYVGDWDYVNTRGEHFVMAIRNIDDKLYYIDSRKEDAAEVSRFVGFLCDVRNATFAHVRGLTDDGEVAQDWLLMRLELTGEKLVIRQLSDEFFKSHPINSSEQLRAVIEQNMGNETMYNKEETVTATRIAR
jgi:hypothetical protein